jgi:hypothetical protein
MMKAKHEYKFEKPFSVCSGFHYSWLGEWWSWTWVPSHYGPWYPHIHKILPFFQSYEMQNIDTYWSWSILFLDAHSTKVHCFGQSHHEKDSMSNQNSEYAVQPYYN